MQNDQRLTPLPVGAELQPTQIEFTPSYTPSSYDDTLDNKRSIRQYIHVVVKRLPIILAITIFVTAGAAFYSYRQPSIFSATTVMTIEPRKPQVTQKDAININFGDDQKYYNTQLQLLKNQDLMRRVVIALGLHREPNLFGNQNLGLVATIRSMFSGGQKPAGSDNSLPVVSEAMLDPDKDGQPQLTPEETSRAGAYAAMLAGGLSVTQLERTNIVNIELQTSNQIIAPKVADKVADLFIKEDEKRETAGADKALKELKASIEELRAAIAQKENDFIAEMRASNLPLQEKGGELRASNLVGLLTLWREARDGTGKFQATLDAARNALGTGDILAVVGENKAIQDARSQNAKRVEIHEKRVEEIEKKIFEASENREKLLTKYTEEYRDVVAVNAQLKELRSQKELIEKDVAGKIEKEGKQLIENAEKEALGSLSAQLAAAKQREERQRVAFEQAAAKANIEGLAETKLIGLDREIKTSRGLLDAYLQREKEQELALSTGRPNNIKIQNNAVMPGGPIGPQRGRNILVAFLLSLAAGIGLAFLLDYLDDSVRTSDDVSRHLGLPTLALIPHYLNTDKKKLLLPAKNGNAPFQPAALITLEERHSPMAEAYRHLRTSLLFSSAGKPPQTILVTSSQPSEGKTTTAINTAITLAQADADVVIVDCDLRRPRLHSHFGLDNSQGLTNYLSGDKNTENLIRTYKDMPRLKIITSGPIPPNPAELLSSNEMRNLLQFLAGRFKHVIVDSPPAISFTDASILSTIVDGVILVAMANKSSIHLMRQFKQRVNNIGARIYGVVLNGIKANSTEYYYYGSGYYKYYSKSEEDESTPVMDTKARAATHDTKG